MLESVREFDVYILNTGCGEINTSCVPLPLTVMIKRPGASGRS